MLLRFFETYEATLVFEEESDKIHQAVQEFLMEEFDV